MRSVEDIKKHIKGSVADIVTNELLLDIREQLKDLAGVTFELERIHKEIEWIRLRKP